MYVHYVDNGFKPSDKLVQTIENMPKTGTIRDLYNYLFLKLHGTDFKPLRRAHHTIVIKRGKLTEVTISDQDPSNWTKFGASCGAVCLRADTEKLIVQLETLGTLTDQYWDIPRKFEGTTLNNQEFVNWLNTLYERRFTDTNFRGSCGSLEEFHETQAWKKVFSHLWDEHVNPTYHDGTKGRCIDMQRAGNCLGVSYECKGNPAKYDEDTWTLIIRYEHATEVYVGANDCEGYCQVNSNTLYH